MDKSRIRYAIKDDICFLKFSGRIAYPDVLGFSHRMEEMAKKGDFSGMVVDLSETQYIDSTNLGELTKLALFLKKLTGQTSYLLSTNSMITEIIMNMGLNSIFCIARDLHGPADDKKDLHQAKHSRQEAMSRSPPGPLPASETKGP